MSDEDTPRNSFEDALRAIADEVTRSVERIQELDFDEIARTVGVDPDQAKHWVDDAGQWLRGQAEKVEQAPFFAFEASSRPPSRPASRTPAGDPLRGAGPHPLDLPTAEQGLALAALDSGRWTMEPGTSSLTSHGDGPGPSDAMGLVRELRVRDWLAIDGELTLAGRRALDRWLESGHRT